MKAFRQVISVIMAVLMLVTAAPLASVSAAEEKTENYTLTLENTYNDSLTAGSSSLGQMSFFGSTEFNGCYGNQLPELARELYDSMVKQFATDKKTGEYTHTFGTAFTFKAEISNGEIVMNEELEEIAAEISCAMQSAIDAFLYDHPEVFWLRITSSSYGVSASGNSSIGYTGIIDSIDITPSEIYSGASSKLSQYSSAVDASLGAITVTESRYDTLKNIHDYICGNAWYNLVNEQRVHSSEAFFIGDGGVVCEGYAKSFKVICDRLGIPCALVSGDAGGAHMWNYVQMDDGKWYLVDATWDDQKSGIMYTYFLANANTLGFDDVTISEERTERNDFSGTGIFTFTYPVLSETAYTAHVHQWESDYTVDVEPTCTQKGSKSIHCKSCSVTKSVTEVEATGHEWIGATCTTKKKCLNCGETKGAILGHNYISNVVREPTCTTEGFVTYSCSRCMDCYTESISRTGHRNTTIFHYKYPTCTEDGYTDGEYCNDCNKWVKGNVLPATNHEGTTHSFAQKHPTCTENGYTEGEYCYVCETWVSGHEVISPTYHLNRENRIQQDATCTEVGYTTGVYCIDCESWIEGHVEISAKGHIDKNEDVFCDSCDEYLAKVIENGTCGADIKYEFYEDGTLIISGEGPMDQSGTVSPWYSYSDSIKKVYIKDGVTYIKHYAFLACYNLLHISIPESVTSIGSSAFESCGSLKQIVLPDSVRGIGDKAFTGCVNLESIVIPEKVECISGGTFFSCDNLKSIYISNNIRKIDKNAFGFCDNLTDIYYTGTPEKWSYIDIEEYGNDLRDVTVHFRWGHSDASTIIKNSSCSEYGEIRYTCIQCNDSYVENIPMLPHTPLSSVTENRVAPKCETKGSYDEVVYCSVCDGEISRTEKEIPALSHDWGEAVTETVATCKTHGIKIYTCKNDSDHKKREQMGLNPENHEGGEYIKGAVKATCTSEGYTGDTCCKGCDVKLSSGEKIERLSHTCRTVTTKATLTENGKTESKCSACGEVESVTDISYPKTIRLSSSEVTYNGKVRTPSVIVKDGQGVALVKDLDYTVTYESGRKLPGRYTVTVTFKGNYEGTKELTFTILPKAPAAITASQSTSVINLKWSASAGATGYRVYQYSPSKGKYVSVASVKGVTSYRKSTSLKAGTQYSFKIKPYTKLADGTVLWGVASDAFATATECKAPSITSVASPSKSKATVKWSNVSGETGFQLYYATSKNGTYKKVKTYGENVLAGSKTFSSSASGKTIYFKVRAYSKVNGQTIFSSWSAVKSVKLK